ncbi:MAG TPA: Mur ligase family protein [Candidatus Saccharimonadales bacterium]
MANKEKVSRSVSLITAIIRSQARTYVRLKSPTVIAVAGSVGKTSTKLYLSAVLGSSAKVRCMDDSYNNGIGLYLSVFNKKIPTHLHSPLAWLKVILSNLGDFFKSSPDYLILEYGIDGVGDMDEMIDFIRPDIAILTAVTPEHMEFLKDIDTVGAEEGKILASAKKFALVNTDSVAEKYYKDMPGKIYTFGSNPTENAHFELDSYTRTGSIVSFFIEKEKLLISQPTKLVSDALISQLCGAILLAHKLGIPTGDISTGLESVQPAASRMRILKGLRGSILIDDSANFSPEAGVVALQTLKKLDAKRYIAVLGNMHELGEYIDKGYNDVAAEFGGLTMIVLVGDLSPELFTPLAENQGFKKDETLFTFPDSLTAGNFLKDIIDADDAVLVKGPFGGFYLEETAKLLLDNPSDRKYLTRQSPFWLEEKSKHFGQEIK